MSRKDTSGYYAALGLDQSATSDQIKKAFKAKAQQCHPDKNPVPEATRQFQLINEAYHALAGC
jgi:molecular chaperone DnaJ